MPDKYRLQIKLEGTQGFITDGETYNTPEHAKQTAEEYAVKGFWEKEKRMDQDIGMFRTPKDIKYIRVEPVKDEAPVTEVDIKETEKKVADIDGSQNSAPLKPNEVPLESIVLGHPNTSSQKTL